MRALQGKKGNTELILTGVLVLTLAAFLLVMGLIMLDELQVNTATDQVTVYNETLTSVDTSTADSVSTIGKCGFNSFTVVRATLANQSDIIPATNYTVTSGRGIGSVIATMKLNNTYNETNWNVTYTYSYGSSEACTAVNNTIEGQGKFAGFIDLIVLAIIITVIISMLLVVMAGRRTK